MSLAANFVRTATILYDKRMSPEALRDFIAGEANRRVQELIANRQAPATYRMFVNGVENAPGRTVALDGTGSIRYVFSKMVGAMVFALSEAVRLSPQESGDYRRNWFWIVNGQPWTSSDYSAIPLGSTIMLTNRSEYHRKIDVGGMHLRRNVAPQIVERVRQNVLRQFPGIDAERIFVTLPGGYILKGRAVRSGLHYDKRTRKFQRLHAPRLTNRADARKGEAMTYPSLVIRELV